ncbi:DNA-processing protein DprA [Cellulomonas phragmiteti]|uniref:DNA-processing protein DprA n=1 Tax=Cellulomonas phragmiteti TaxID=478780 RepID=UPI00364224B6
MAGRWCPEGRTASTRRRTAARSWRGPDPGRARRGRRPRLPGGQRAAAGGGRPRRRQPVSEVPPGATPSRSRFLQRNRLIAAISGATVVVEAAWRSGAVSTATTRDVCCAPWVRCRAPSPRRRRRLPPPAARRGRRVRHGRGGGHRARRARGTRSGARAGRGCGTRHGRPRPAGPGGARRVVAPDRARHLAGRRARRTTLAQARAMLGLLELEGLARRAASGWVVGDAHE